MNSYKTISQNIELEIEPIKKSRFIAYLYKVESEQDALSYISELKAKFPDANHHCWAFSLIKENKFRFSDDGEPSGSAGKPILSHIQGHDLTNVLVVVVRYFGGTKLGVGGLIRAYGQAAKEVLKLAEIIEVQPQSHIRIEYGYTETTNIEIIIKRFCAEVINQSYDSNIVINVKVNSSDRLEFIQEVINITRGSAKVKETK
ncbi:ABC transporter [Candidatus Francisella endociliophora]|uniref:ABC transporter n=1 Tax=Candidatus Francisella endociliophora TaxID=653937 RepID=A0A097ENV6_9GAMM|nr:YigZ family protein [Francisella sp. FSC1006]AIT09247.1 ABC transporter [Francisella sp. FSC1006]